MAVLKQAVTYNRSFLMVQSADHITGLTGQNGSLVVAISKNGASFVTAGGSTTEIGNGWYSIAFTTIDTGTLGDLAIHATATGGDPTDFCDQVQAHLVSDISIDGSGNVAVNSPVKRNTSFTLPFVMTINGVPTAGLTVTAQRNFGSGFSPCANVPTDQGNGTYQIVLIAADTNAANIMYRFTAPTADDRDIWVPTQP